LPLERKRAGWAAATVRPLWESRLPDSYPANDARDISESLRQLGFSVTTLVDAGINDMEEGIRGLAKTLQRDPDGMGVFFYGHHALFFFKCIS
jgi:hypothetical protein